MSGFRDWVPDAEIAEPVLLIRIADRYRPDMSDTELYEATRGIWRVGAARETVHVALAVFDGVVVEAYEIDSWHPAGTNQYLTRSNEHLAVPGRWEFLGSIASHPIRSRYVNRSVRRFLPTGAQNPIRYLMPEEASKPTREYVGMVESDTGTLIIGDPGQLLAGGAHPEGLSFERVVSTRGSGPIDDFGVLVQDFGGDATFAVFVERDGPDVLEIVLRPVELP